jgi:hypothetical protein
MFIMLSLALAALMAPKAADAMPPMPWQVMVSTKNCAPFSAVPASMAMGNWEEASSLASRVERDLRETVMR